MKNYRLSTSVVLLLILLVAGSNHALASSFNVMAKPTVLSPDGDGVNDRTRIEYSLPDSGLVKIKIYQVLSKKRHDQMEPEKEYVLVRNLPTASGQTKQAGSHAIEWNGTNDSGAVVQNGDYQVRIIFAPKSGAPVTDSSLILRIEVIPVFTDLKFLPDPFTPGRQKASIEFRQTKRAHVVLAITGPQGMVLSRNLGELDPQKQFLDWDGKDNRGEFVTREGQYTVVLSAMSKDRKKVMITTKFDITPHLQVQTISATPRIFDPNDVSGNTGTRVRFKVDNPHVEYVATIQDASGMTVWQQEFKDQSMDINKAFGWGGVKNFHVKGEYIISRKKTIEKGQEKILEETLASTIPFSYTVTYGRGGQDKLFYDDYGRLDKKKIYKDLINRKKIRSIGEKIEHQGRWWKIEDIKLDARTDLFLDGSYFVRIKVKDPVSKKVSAEFGTEVRIRSLEAFKLCIKHIRSEYFPGLQSGTAASSPKNRSEGCENESLRKGYFSLKGGTLELTLKNDADYFDPESLQWYTVDKIEPYLAYRDDDLTVMFDVTKDADVAAQILSDKRGVVRKLPYKKAHLHTDKSHAQFDWDGRDDEGNYVPSGNYFFEVTATDTDPKSPKTVNTEAEIFLEDIRKLVTFDMKNSNLKEEKLHNGFRQMVADYYAFPTVVPFKEITGVASDSGLDDILEGVEMKTKSLRLSKKEGEEGYFNIILNNHEGKEFYLDYMFTTFTEDPRSDNVKVFRTAVIDVNRKKSDALSRDLQQCKITVGYREVGRPGLFDLWIFAHSGDVCRNVNQQQGSWERAQSLIDCYKREGRMTVKNIKIRGLGHLTETGLHMDKVLADGFESLARKTGEYR